MYAPTALTVERYLMYSKNIADYPDILTSEHVMNILNIGRNTTYKLLSCGLIPSIRIGKLYRIQKSKLISALDQYTDGFPIEKKGVPC